MKLSKAIGTILLCLLLLLGTVLSLGTGLLRFVVMNPALYRAFLARPAFLNELRERLGENLDHIAVLYGLEEGELAAVVTDEQLKAYTAALTDALFDPAETETLTLPDFPKDGFSEYLKSRTAFSEQAIDDLSADCAASVTDDLSAINTELIVSAFSRLKDDRFQKLGPVLLFASLALVGILIAMLAVTHAESPRVGRVAIFGGLFMGAGTVFVPLSEFWLFDYIGRLNLGLSALRTILSGYLSVALYACLAISGGLLLFLFLCLWIACARAARLDGKGRKKAL